MGQRIPEKEIANFKFIGMIQQLFLHGKKNPTGKEKIIYHNTEKF